MNLIKRATKRHTIWRSLPVVELLLAEGVVNIRHVAGEEQPDPEGHQHRALLLKCTQARDTNIFLRVDKNSTGFFCFFKHFRTLGNGGETLSYPQRHLMLERGIGVSKGAGHPYANRDTCGTNDMVSIIFIISRRHGGKKTQLIDSN